MIRSLVRHPHDSSARSIGTLRCFAHLGGVELVLLLLLSSCGGQTPSASAPSERQSTEEPDETEGLASDEQSSAEQPTTPDPCAGGQCTPCGDTVCVAGFLCDERAQACSWLPQCASDQSCDCVRKVLPDCSCEQRGGGLYLTCSE